MVPSCSSSIGISASNNTIHPENIEPAHKMASGKSETGGRVPDGCRREPAMSMVVTNGHRNGGITPWLGTVGSCWRSTSIWFWTSGGPGVADPSSGRFIGEKRQRVVDPTAKGGIPG